MDVNKEVATIIGQLVIENTTLKVQIQSLTAERDALAKALEDKNANGTN